MLERATACLKSAARDSLRCAQRAPRSKRMLHSTFWNHGAGVLDLPSWAFSMFPFPSDLSSKDNSTAAHSVRNKRSKQERPSWASLADGAILDFLYPPQALAWLRHSKGQQLQRWEKRNIRRLPEGYKLVSRRYASASHGPHGLQQEAAKKEFRTQDEDVDDTTDWFHQAVGDAYKHERWSNNGETVFEANKPETHAENVISSGAETKEHEASNQDSVFSDYGFPDSPSDLAEAMTDRMRTLRNIIMSTREKLNVADPINSRALTERAWNMYQSLDEESKNDIKLKQELLVWLAAQNNELAAVHCTELYHSIDGSKRTFEIYAAALKLFLRRDELHLASELHTEALANLENGYLISRTLFRHAIDHGQWLLAAQTATQHTSMYAEANQLSQIRVFWLHVSEIPQLFAKAVKLAQSFGGIIGLRSANEETRQFCFKFFKEAVSQEFLQGDEAISTYRSAKQAPSRRRVEPVLQHIFDMETAPAKFAEGTLAAVFRSVPQALYWKYHHIASFVYKQYRQLSDTNPSEQLLFDFLHRLTRYWGAKRVSKSNVSNVSIDDLVEDWKRCHTKISRRATVLLVTHAARFGIVKEHERWMTYLRSTCSRYADRKDVLWTMVYVHARRADLDKAQQAFAEVRRIMSEHNDQPDIKCWNVLLHAHYRVDDLDGALTNFQNLISHAHLKPNYASFNPLLLMVAKRGDVEGTEDLLEQYDQLAADKARHTSLMQPLMTAHIKNNDNVRAAEVVLKKTISMRRSGEVFGPLTQCFNCLMGSYALHRDLNNTMRVYRWMKQEKVPMDSDSFTPLIQVLTFFRQPKAASRIITEVMPEHVVQPTAYHYTLLTAGYTRTGQYASAQSVHREMTEKNIRPSLSSNIYFLKAKAAQERRDNAKGQPMNHTVVPLEETIRELKALIEQDSGAEVASGTPRPMTDKLDLDDPKTAYFDFLISIHGARQCFDAVQELFNLYQEARQKDDKDEEPIPVRMLSALMSAHWYAGEYEKVEECWTMAKRQADVTSSPIQVPRLGPLPSDEETEVDPLELKPSTNDISSEHERSSEANHPKSQSRPASAPSEPTMDRSQTLLLDKQTFQQRPSRGMKHILNRPLQWYLKALASESRTSDAINTVAQLLKQGYLVNKRAFNLFITSLLETSPPLALLAFVLTERFLIPEFPGWTRNTQWTPTIQAKRERLQRIRARYLKRNQLMPEYETLVRLGAALLEVRRVEAVGRKGVQTDVPPELRRYVGTMRQIRARAPKTLYAVQSMPMVPDKIQSKWLRGVETR